MHARSMNENDVTRASEPREMLRSTPPRLAHQTFHSSSDLPACSSGISTLLTHPPDSGLESLLLFVTAVELWRKVKPDLV